MHALLLAAASLAGYIGFACLALAMPRHWIEVSGRKTAPHRRWLRPCGFALLGIAYALCVHRDGASFGSVLGMILLSAAAGAVALTLAWRPRLLSLLTLSPHKDHTRP